MKHQGGAVLLVTVFVLVLLLVLGLSVAGSSRVTLLGAAASAARVQALQQARGALEGFVERQRLARGGSLWQTNGGSHLLADTVFAAEHQIGFIGEAPCKRSALADSGSSFICRTNQVSSTVRFGRGGRGSIGVTIGIEQQVLQVGN